MPRTVPDLWRKRRSSDKPCEIDTCLSALGRDFRGLPGPTGPPVPRVGAPISHVCCNAHTVNAVDPSTAACSENRGRRATRYPLRSPDSHVSRPCLCSVKSPASHWLRICASPQPPAHPSPQRAFAPSPVPPRPLHGLGPRDLPVYTGSGCRFRMRDAMFSIPDEPFEQDVPLSEVV